MIGWRTAGLAFAALATMGAAPSYRLGPNSYRDAYWSNAAAYEDLTRFIGMRAARYKGYTVPQWSIPEQVSDAMGIPGEDTLLFDDGTRIVWGSRPHSADEKSAVVISRDNVLEAVGLINFHCRFVSRADRAVRSNLRKSTCDDVEQPPTLTMFLRRNGAYRQALEAWAEHATGKRLPTEVVWVDPKPAVAAAMPRKR